MRASILILATILAQAGTSGEAAAAPAEVFKFNDFAIYVPADAATVRGILFALGGPDTRAFFSEGSFGAPNPELESSLHVLGQQLRTLAADHGFALLGTSRRRPTGLPNHSETDKLIFEAIAEAARVSGREEITRVPIVLYGISGGTLQAAGFTARNPQRVAALLLKVPAPPERLISAEALAVPTYLILAELEVILDNVAVNAAFEYNRSAGGLWTRAVQPGVPHHSLTPAERALTVNWLDAILDLRLGASLQDPLRDIPESSGWLGDPDVGVAHWADFTGDRKAASWFPSRATAEEWWKFIGKNDAPYPESPAPGAVSLHGFRQIHPP